MRTNIVDNFSCKFHLFLQIFSSNFLPQIPGHFRIQPSHNLLSTHPRKLPQIAAISLDKLLWMNQMFLNWTFIFTAVGEIKWRDLLSLISQQSDDLVRVRKHLRLQWFCIKGLARFLRLWVGFKIIRKYEVCVIISNSFRVCRHRTLRFDTRRGKRRILEIFGKS